MAQAHARGRRGRNDVTAVYYEGPGASASARASVQPPGPGEVRIDVAFCGVCGTDIHIAHGHMDHRVRVPQVIGHEMSGTIAELGPGVDRLRRRRPRRRATARHAGRDARGQGREPHLPRPQVPRDRHAGRVPELLDGARIHPPPAAAGRRPAPGGARRAAGGRLPRRAPRRCPARRVRARDRRRADRPARRPRRRRRGSRR